MSENSSVVLPDTLVAQLIDNAATLSRHLQLDFDAISAQRNALRARLISERKIIKVNTTNQPLDQAFAIDGAHLAEIDRASAYSVSCAVRVGQVKQPNDQSSCLAILPHVASLNTLSSGLMMMQEIMMTVKASDENSEAVCLIDGSRITAIIAINSFYTGLKRDLPNQLYVWRQQAKDEPDREPGKTLALFESRDWLTPYLTLPTIAGNLKLVTTNIMIQKYMPEWVGRFDDKTFAALVLENGEALDAIKLEANEPYHIADTYPFYSKINQRGGVGDSLTQENNPNCLYHIYYKPDSAHGVFKIELNEDFRSNSQLLSRLFAWWVKEIQSPDLQEPYSYYIADRFAKEAVSVAKNALKEITLRGASASPWAWFFTQPYRTE